MVSSPFTIQGIPCVMLLLQTPAPIQNNIIQASIRNQGTKILEKLATSPLQQTHLSKLFIANVTRQSSHKLKQRHGHTIMLRGELWHTTHCGPPSPIPEAPSAHDFWAWGEAWKARRVMIRCSKIWDSSSGVSLPVEDDETKFEGRWRVEVRTFDRSRCVRSRYRDRVTMPLCAKCVESAWALARCYGVLG